MIGQPLKGKVVVVTGASAGVGRATARAFARQGAKVGLIARDRDRLEAARSEVAAMGGQAFVAAADMADANAVEQAADAIEEALGPLHVWVNCAMATVIAPFEEVEPQEFERVTQVTYLGNVNGMRAALRRMQPRDEGIIVQVGSALAYRGIPLQAPYCGAKHAIKGYTESVRAELLASRSGIHITTVELPAVNTPQFDWALNKLPHKARPLAPVYQPEVAAEGIVWAATAGRREVLVGSSTLLTIWGNRLAPGLMARMLAQTAVSGQQTGEPESPDRPHNLWHTVSGDFGARGRFSAEAHGSSAELALSRHRTSLAALGLALLAGAAVAVVAGTRDGASSTDRSRREWRRIRSGRRG